jgi:hypothetical protein
MKLVSRFAFLGLFAGIAGLGTSGLANADYEHCFAFDPVYMQVGQRHVELAVVPQPADAEDIQAAEPPHAAKLSFGALKEALRGEKAGVETEAAAAESDNK